MNKLFLAAILSLTVWAADAFSQNGVAYFQTIAGNWEGTLEYQDYSADKRVKLKTYLTVTPAPDGDSAEFQTVYDDFGRIIKSKEIYRIDRAAKKYFAGEFAYAIDSIEAGKIVLLGSGQDGETVEPIRQTITFDDDSLVILKETRQPRQFRNQTIFKRSKENVLAQRVLTAAQMREDLEILKRTLTAMHPGIYRYQTPESLAKIFAEFEAKAKNRLSENDFFLVVSQITSRLSSCGHTYQNPYNADALLRERLFNRKTHLPFYFRIVGGKFITTENASDKDLSKGSEIKTINGVPAKKIVETLLTVTKSDGRNTVAHRIRSIELARFEAERYALFDLYYPLFFPPKTEIFTIEAVDFMTKKPVKFQTPAMTKDERTEEMAKRYGASPTYDDGWKFTVQNDSTAFLKIANSITWRLKTIKFKEFLADAFAEMRRKNVRKLVIDLRGNGGGDMNVGFELSKYLAGKELPVYAAHRRLVRAVAAQTDLAKHLETYNEGLKTWLRNGVPPAIYKSYDDNFFEILPNENTDNFPKVTPYENNFRGQAFVIADASNASATFQFLDYVKTNRLAKIVGQTSGGNRQGINGGSYFFLRLPNSKIETDIPAYFQAPLAAQPDAGVAPDIAVRRQPSDVGNDLDPEMAAIKNLPGAK